MISGHRRNFYTPIYLIKPVHLKKQNGDDRVYGGKNVVVALNENLVFTRRKFANRPIVKIYSRKLGSIGSSSESERVCV